MFGQGKDLSAANERFASALSSTTELITAAEAVHTAIEGEIAQLEAQIAKFKDRDPDPGETETVIAIRQGALMALIAERGRWRKILAELRGVPARPIDPTGYAYFEGNPPPDGR
ncbi:hypothetical protein ACFC06_04775 [Nocardia sp. NPDC056064]|uniref:hypothetical protein n=1 Tax=Nocardia sp. NPDC056064 TaxID=3345701 RepID=UPI0035D7B8C4